MEQDFAQMCFGGRPAFSDFADGPVPLPSAGREGCCSVPGRLSIPARSRLFSEGAMPFLVSFWPGGVGVEGVALVQVPGAALPPPPLKITAKYV